MNHDTSINNTNTDTAQTPKQKTGTQRTQATQKLTRAETKTQITSATRQEHTQTIHKNTRHTTRKKRRHPHIKTNTQYNHIQEQTIP